MSTCLTKSEMGVSMNNLKTIKFIIVLGLAFFQSYEAFGLTASVRGHKGRPALFINGRVEAPFMFYGYPESIIQKLLAGMYGLKLVVADYVRLKKLFFWVMARRGFVTSVVSILVVPLLSSIGITPQNTSGIVAKFFLAKVQKPQRSGSKNVKVGSGTDRCGSY